MTSFSAQIAEARVVSRAKAALDTQARFMAQAAIQGWIERANPSLANGMPEIESVVRSAYHSSAALARTHMRGMVGLDGWEPPVEKRTPPYLRALLDDVRRNMREYLQGSKDEAAVRRLMLRVQHSAGIASQRGYTDAMIRSGASLEKIGVIVRKMWMANFVNNTPCPECASRHGLEVSLNDQFDSGTLRVYRDLLGPPAHPHCRCILVLLVVGPDNITEPVDMEESPEGDAPEEMSSDDVRKMPKPLFLTLISALGKLIRFVGRLAS